MCSRHVRSKDARSILAFNLAMECCSSAFPMVYRGLFFSAFGKISSFHGVKCMGILRSMDTDQAVLILHVVDGEKNLG